MKLFIWEGVLTDYSDGMIVAVAPDLESALKAADDNLLRAEMGRFEPTVIDLVEDVKAQVWHVWGGG